MQMPPKYSAKCVDGKRGYELARKGVEFTLTPKKVTVLSAEVLEQTANDEFSFKFVCKGGTYIRSLARDIALKCNTLGVMSSLLRSASGIFNINNGVTVEEFFSSASPEKYLIPSDSVVSFEKLVLSNERATKILNGVFDDIGVKDGTYRVYNENNFWGIGKAEKGVLRINTYVR